MGKPQDIASKVAQKAGANVPAEQQGEKKPLTFNQQVDHVVIQLMPTLEKLLGKNVDAARFSRIVVSEVRKNPKLAQCSLESIIGCVIQSAKLALEPGLMGLCYILPFWNSKANNGSGAMEAQFQIGYKGYIDLAMRTGKIANVEAHVVYEDDEFYTELGTHKKLVHKPNYESETYGDPNHARFFYSIVYYTSGIAQFKVITKAQAIKHGLKYSKAVKENMLTGVWRKEFEAMAMKSAIKMLFKTVPISTEFQQQVAMDETVLKSNEPDVVNSVHEYVDADFTEITPA